MSCGDYRPFWQEQAVWPYVHSLIPMAVYIATRDLRLSILVLYISETLELLGAGTLQVLAECIWDALLGDILIGTMAIFNLWLLDQRDDAGLYFKMIFSPWWRLAAFLFAFASMPLAPTFPIADTVTLGVLIFYVLYAAGGAWFYWGALKPAPYGSPEYLAGRSVATWLVYAGIYALVAFPISDQTATSRFFRMASVSLLLFLTSAVLYLFRDKPFAYPVRPKFTDL